MQELGVRVANVPDIPYAYRSRRQLPDGIAQHGFSAVIIDDSKQGEAPNYLFTKIEQLIRIPEQVDQTRRTSSAALPEAVRKYIGKDEQGALTQVRYAGILDDFTGLRTSHLQSHLRMRVGGREAELDDLYIGVDTDGSHHALAVEAKGAGETLNKNQLIRNTRGIAEDSHYPDSVRTLALKLDSDDFFFLFEFDLNTGRKDGNVLRNTRVWKYIFS